MAITTTSTLLTMTGSAVTYAIPASTTSVVFIMRGGNIVVKAPSSGTGVTLIDGSSIQSDNPNDAGATWSFNGASGTYVDVFHTGGSAY